MLQSLIVIVAVFAPLLLAAEGVISGRVQSPDDSPSASITVTALRLDYYGEERLYEPIQTVHTRENGAYTIDGLPIGQYYVVAAPQDPSTLQPTYYPAANSPLGAVPISVTPDAEASAIDITLSESPVFSVCGDVELWPGGARRPNTLVLVPTSADLRFLQTRSTTVDSKAGHFCFEGIPPGDYSINGTPVSVSTEDVAGVRVLATSPSRIEGAVRTEQTFNREGTYWSMAEPMMMTDINGGLLELPNPDTALLPAYARHTAANRDSAIQIRLSPVDPVNQEPPVATVRKEGSFALNKVATGRYRVAVENVPLQYFVKSIRYGGKELTSDEFELTPGSPGQLDVLLSGDAVFIRGAVTDGKNNAVAGAVVSLLSESATAGVAQTAVTNDDGRFAFWNLAPGSYLAWAWQDLDPPGLATRPSFFRAFSNRATRVDAIHPADASYNVLLTFVSREDVSR